MKAPILLLCCLCFCQLLAAQIWEERLDNLPDDFSLAEDTDRLLHTPTLNVFFNRQLDTYLSEAGDLTLKRGYALLDNSDGRLFLGGSFTNTDDKTDLLRHVLTLGAKANVKDGFAKLFDPENNFQNDIGISLKYTFVGKGTIKCSVPDSDTEVSASNSDKTILRRKRQYYVEQLRNNIDREKSKISKAILLSTELNTTEKDSESEDEYKKQYKKLKLEFAEEEASLIEEEGLYTASWKWWFSTEVYYPLTTSEFNIGDSIQSIVFEPKDYKPYEFDLSLGFIYARPKLKTYTRLYYEFFQNNSVKAEQIKQFSYEQLLTQTVVDDTTFTASINQDDVYVGEYKNFWTQRLGLEFMFFPWQEYVGLSFGLERYFGQNDFEGTNWKIGFPVSLKDKDGEANVNFELQYKKEMGNKLWGISIGLPIGSALYE